MGNALPKIIKLENAYPGEPKFLRKRRHPKALRFFKVKKDLNPTRFFLHELMMYKSFNSQLYERWHDDENCIEDYEKYRENIAKVKKKIMEWMEDIEEARYFVEETMKNKVDIEETGDILDSEMHKEGIECEMEGIEEDEQYIHLDPEGLKDLNYTNPGNWYRKLELLDTQDLESMTCRLDVWQRKVVDRGIKYARELRKFFNGYGSLPKSPNVVTIGGAGAGKSTVIECLAQWVHRILNKSGDDPNSPYVLKAATTGAASTLIEGSTVHSSLGFDFSSKHTSLNDKKRELKREQLKNLKILIVDEFSMMKADILYRIHLRLREVTQINKDFGGVAVFLFGDPAQLKPVLGSYIFEAPNCQDYKLAYGDGSESLWRSFEAINLEENHRQGKDKIYADMLNRIRLGKQTKEDIQILKSRIRPKGHPDLKEALFISAMVKPVACFNENALNMLPGKLYVSKATHIQAMTKSYKPRIDTITGRVGDTQYVDKLNLKLGARVMLIFNIDVSDLLCNGALGTLVGIEENQKGIVIVLIIKFDNPAAGQETRNQNPIMSMKYPGGTVIKKKEQDYSLARKGGLISSTAKLIQYPIVLAWAVTVHKFQGQTVKYPQKVVIDLRSVFEAAQAYVMKSRVQELEQLYILEKLPEEKIYANHKALSEIERLIEVSINNNPAEWDKEDDKSKTKISFLNCRSMKNKFQHVKSDSILQKSDIFILMETWLEDKQTETDYELPGFKSNLNSIGRGKGIASYYKQENKHIKNVNCEGFSISKFECPKLDVIGIYRSQEGNVRDLILKLEALITSGRTTVIGGDMNICALANPKNYMSESLREMGFNQVVKNATHIEGGMIDHIYVKQGETKKVSYIIEEFPKYYSDHDGVGIILWEEEDS